MNLSEDLKKVVLAGIGAAAVTFEKSKDIVDSLVERGELTVAQGKVINEELKRKAAEKEDADTAAKTSGSSILDEIENLTPEQRAALKAKLEQLDADE